MRTTIDLPEHLLRVAKARAALDGTTLKDLIARFVAQGLYGPDGVPESQSRSGRSKLPVFREKTGRAIPALSNAELHRLLDRPGS